jgi:hypothetical protein
MRRAIVLSTITLLVALIAPAGCGGGESDLAREYCEKADGLYGAATAIGRELDTLKGDLQRIMVANDVGALVAREADIQGIHDKIDRSIKLTDRALVEYQKVLKLKGADRYKEYASMQIEAVGKEQQALAVGRQLTALETGLVAAAKAGKPVNLTDSLTAVSTTVIALDELERDLNAIKLKAGVFARDNKLF